MTPTDRALKTGRKLNRNAARAGDTAWSGGEMLTAAGDVIAARMKIMAEGMTDPAKVDLKELSLMTSEKVEALSESAAVLGQTFGDIGQRLNANAVTEAGLASRAASAIAGASTPAAAMQAHYSYALGWWSRAAGQMLTLNTELLKGQAEALKPIHRTAEANAKRLKP
ncbi:phasin [Brevundimonas sp.]|uniref:phasin n=1 Tax=Brevundimonas sp. TaxID=1871086 RepID=UPI0035B106F9